MPTYEYKCTVCHQKFEMRQDFGDRSLIRCPKCGGITKRLISVVNPTFEWRPADASNGGKLEGTI